MDTERTVQEIQRAIVIYEGGYRKNLFVPNVSWGLLPYEADLLLMTKTGYVTEYEIKRSSADFKADFAKSHTHNSELIYRFYYVIPESILKKALEFLNILISNGSIKELPAILTYDENLRINKHGGCPYCNGKHRKLFIEEQYQLARLGTMRYWSKEFKDTLL